LLAGHEQLFHRIDADLEILLGFVVQSDLDHFLDAVRADDGRNPDVEAVEAVLAVDIDRAGRMRCWSPR
jgi:hypothetical protein